MGRERRYVIASGSPIAKGIPHSRVQWRYVDQTKDAGPDSVELKVPHPNGGDVYYYTCEMIDQHTRHRQDALDLENKLGTLDWSLRVNISIFAITDIDAWLVFSQCAYTDKTKKNLYLSLAEELIDNVHNNPIDSRRNPISEDVTHNGIDLVDLTGRAQYRVDVHLTPTWKKTKLRDETVTRHLLQGRCAISSSKISDACLSWVGYKSSLYGAIHIYYHAEELIVGDTIDTK